MDDSLSQPCGLDASRHSSGLTVEESAAIIAKAICKSGRFETGEGTCAVLCMEAIGDARARQGCRHTSRIHGRMAADIVAALAAATPPVLTADFVRALPGGKLDDSEYEAIETALDRADAPCQDPAGRWLTLAERVTALARTESKP